MNLSLPEYAPTSSSGVPCQSSSYTELMYINSTHRVLLVVLTGIISLLGVTANSAVIYSIIKLSLNRNHSMNLILVLSISDLSVNLVVLPCFIWSLLSTYTCVNVSVMEFTGQGLAHLTCYITGIIGYDRYLRMKYLNGYPRIVTFSKISTVLSIVCFLSLFQGGAYLWGIHHNSYDLVSTISSMYDSIVIFFIALPYILLGKSIRTYRRESTHHNILQHVDQSVNKIAFRIIIVIWSLYTPYITMLAIRRFLPSESPLKKDALFGFILLTSYLFVYANSFVNSIIFLSINTACRRCVHSIFAQETTVQSAT